MRQYPLCCGNEKCQTSQTPLWRKGWVTPEGKTIMLCNACGLHYKKGHYCNYCNQIYRESDADDHANPWIGCDRCSRWVHQKCEEQNGHECKKQKSYLCPDCRNIGLTADPSTAPPTITISTNLPKSSSPSVIKKRRKTPSGTPRGTTPTPDSPTPMLTLTHPRISQLSPMTPTSPISPGSNFVLFAQHHLDKKRLPSCGTPTTPTQNVFDPNSNVMPCWSQLHNAIQTLPATPVTPGTPTSATPSKKRKGSPTSEKKPKKSRTTTTITTTTTHRVNTAGIDALMGAVVAEQSKVESTVPQLTISLQNRKSKQTPRKKNADARTAAIALSTDTPSTPTLFSAPSVFATTTTTTTTTTVVPDDSVKRNVSLSEEQFYQYQQLILQQQNGDGDHSNDSISSSSSGNAKAPVTLLQNTFGSVDTLGNFYGSFNEQDQSGEASPYMMDDDEDYSQLADQQRRPQKRTKRTVPKNVTTTTTTLTMTTISTGAKSKRLRERMAKNGGARTVYASSSETEESDFEPTEQDYEANIAKWNVAAKELNISLDDAYAVLAEKFPQAPVLKKMGSLWAICEVVRQETLRST